MLKGVRASLPRLFLPGRTVPVKKRPSIFHAQWLHHDASGLLLHQSDWEDNLLHDEGELYILSRSFNTAHTNYATVINPMYVGVDNRTTPAEADTLATLSLTSGQAEGGLTAGRVTGGGYDRKGVNTDGLTTGGRPFFDISLTGTPALPAGATAASYATLSSSIVWTATDDWTAVRNIFIATHLTAVTSAAGQRLIASVPMSASRDLAINDTLTVQVKVYLTEIP